MSLPVDLAALRDRLADFGSAAYLVTVNDDRTPHVVSVELRPEGARLVMAVGRRSRHNVEANPAVTLLWPPRADPAYSMVVDATYVADAAAPGDAGEIAVEPHSAVLHRLAGSAGDGPSCLPLHEPAAGT